MLMFFIVVTHFPSRYPVYRHATKTEETNLLLNSTQLTIAEKQFILFYMYPNWYKISKKISPSRNLSRNSSNPLFIEHPGGKRYFSLKTQCQPGKVTTHESINPLLRET